MVRVLRTRLRVELVLYYLLGFVGVESVPDEVDDE